MKQNIKYIPSSLSKLRNSSGEKNKRSKCHLNTVEDNWFVVRGVF